jgi:hypothetical protein
MKRPGVGSAFFVFEEARPHTLLKNSTAVKFQVELAFRPASTPLFLARSRLQPTAGHSMGGGSSTMRKRIGLQGSFDFASARRVNAAER